MNTQNNATVLADLEVINSDGDHVLIKVMGLSISIRRTKDLPMGEVMFDISDYPARGKNTVVRVPLQELLTAIGGAAINADDERE